MNIHQEKRMEQDIDQLNAPMEATIITKHHCFSFITFILSEVREEVKEILKDSDKYEEMKRELQILRLNRVLGRCNFPTLCNSYDFCDLEDCDANECESGRAFKKNI